jgi:DNA-binding NarL/FixJ family response regulator
MHPRLLRLMKSTASTGLGGRKGAPARVGANVYPSGARRVLIVEDHPVFREGLVQILAGEEDLVVAGECGSAEQGFKDFLRVQPDLLIVDLSLPGQNGLELIRQIREASREVKLLVVSMHDEAVYADRALSAGADGYIMKQEDFSEILHAMRDVLAGHIYLSESVLARSRGDLQSHARQFQARTLDQLSDSQLEILELLGLGKSNAEIARKLKLPLRTVDRDCKQMWRTLQLSSYNQLIRYAVCWVEQGGR